MIADNCPDAEWCGRRSPHSRQLPIADAGRTRNHANRALGGPALRAGRFISEAVIVLTHNLAKLPAQLIKAGQGVFAEEPRHVDLA